MYSQKHPIANPCIYTLLIMLVRYAYTKSSTGTLIKEYKMDIAEKVFGNSKATARVEKITKQSRELNYHYPIKILDKLTDLIANEFSEFKKYEDLVTKYRNHKEVSFFQGSHLKPTRGEYGNAIEDIDKWAKREFAALENKINLNNAANLDSINQEVLS